MWPDEFEDDLNRIRNPSDDIKTYVHELPNELSIINAGNILARLKENGLKPNSIGIMGDGGIGIAFIKDNRYADVECCNSGDMLCSYRSDCLEFANEFEDLTSEFIALLRTF